MISSNQELHLLQQAACLIEQPMYLQFQRNIGTGFFIKDDANKNIFYFCMTNHNFDIFFPEKSKLSSENTDIDKFSENLNNFFIYYPKYDTSHNYEPMPLIPSFIESLIIPRNRWENGELKEENDFAILKINFNIDKRKFEKPIPHLIPAHMVEHHRLMPETYRLDISAICYDLPDNHTLSCIKHYNKENLFFAITGFPTSKTDIDYEYKENTSLFNLAYQTVWVNIEAKDIDTSIIRLNNHTKNNGQPVLNLINEMNGLSGSPLTLFIQDRNTSESCKKATAIGMAITPHHAISMLHIKNILKNTHETLTISNPNFSELVFE